MQFVQYYIKLTLLELYQLQEGFRKTPGRLACRTGIYNQETLRLPRGKDIKAI